MKKAFCTILSAVLLCLALTGCGKSQTAGDDSKQDNQNAVGEPVLSLQEPVDVIGFGLNSNDAKLLDILGKDAKGNLFVSTMSIDMALGMLLSGAEGSTYDALCKYLGMTKEQAAETVKGLMDVDPPKYEENQSSLQRPGTNVSIANSFWYEFGQNVSQEYIDFLKKYYDAEVQEVDFQNDAAEKINNWVADKTRQLIKEIVSKKGLESASDVLVNAIYFKGPWVSKFYDVEDEEFTLFNGQKVWCEMMYGGGNSYMENDAAVAFSKYYYGGYKFIGILPKDTGDFTWESLQLQTLFDSESFEYSVDVHMPKFETEYAASLSDVLSELGLGIMFTGDANFNGIAPGLAVSDVLHKAVLKIDEKGTEAAAVTAITTIRTTSYKEREPIIKTVILDRPFAFLILDQHNNVLFAGKILDPNK